MTEFRFDWQAAPEGFLKWLLPVLVANRRGEDQFDELSKITDKFTDVRLTIQVNGLEVDAENFLNGVEHNMEYYAKVEARRLLDEVGRFDDLEDLLASAKRTVMQDVEQRLSAAGIELPDREGRYD